MKKISFLSPLIGTACLMAACSSEEAWRHGCAAAPMAGVYIVGGAKYLAK